LSVGDNLQRALDLAEDILDEKSLPMIEGLELTKKDLLETFKRNRIDKIEPVTGEKFDPKLHQAMFEAPSDSVEKNSIMQVLSIGFSISDRLLRAAQVAVSSGNPNKVKDLIQKENEEDLNNTE
jgi:molecular chaperone GrpE